jgi:DNA-binding protein YbaB
VIPRNEEMIEDIKQMVNFVYEMLMGFESWENFPYALVSKYSKVTKLEDIENILDEEIDMLQELSDLKEEKSNLEKEIKAIEDRVKEKWSTGKYENDRIKVTISETHKRGALDVDRLSIEHPEIDYSKYIKEDVVFRTLRVIKK